MKLFRVVIISIEQQIVECNPLHAMRPNIEEKLRITTKYDPESLIFLAHCRLRIELPRIERAVVDHCRSNVFAVDPFSY